jgi:ABC-type transporter Mla maintaining outer membrane lipid asymmetry ATPase subunit MlaF
VSPGDALVEIDDVVTKYGASEPLRIRHLSVRPGERVAIAGLDVPSAEVVVLLITGASLPDEGRVRVYGGDTRDIATDTEWLASLDRFGIITRRAVLIGALPIAANLALPLTLAIDPMSSETRAEVEQLAANVGLPAARLDAPASTLAPQELVRVHLARALATRPEMLLLEHATLDVADPAASADLGRTLRAAADRRGIGWLAVSEDEAFVRASGSDVRRVDTATGTIAAPSRWPAWLSPFRRLRTRRADRR